MSGGGTSPKNRAIEAIADDGDSIWSRGYEIERLGEMMESAADTLEGLKNGTLEGEAMVGEAVDSLKDVIGDSFEKLREAADLYKPVGPPIQEYGSAMMVIKHGLNASVDECYTKWTAYQNAPGPEVGMAPPALGPEPGTPEADDSAKEAEKKQDLYDAWHEEAESFDSYYDTWEEAYEQAVRGVTDGTSGQIEDSFWDDIGPLLDALGYVALFLAIAAIFLTGPFAALALILSAVILAGRLGQALFGNGSWADVGWAALGVIPFGAAGRAFSGAFKGASRVAGLGGKFSTASTVFGKVGFRATKATLSGWDDAVRLRPRGDVISAFTRGGEGSTAHGKVWEQGHTLVSNWAKGPELIDTVSKWSGGPTLNPFSHDFEPGGTVSDVLDVVW